MAAAMTAVTPILMQNLLRENQQGIAKVQITQVASPVGLWRSSCVGSSPVGSTSSLGFRGIRSTRRSCRTRSKLASTANLAEKVGIVVKRNPKRKLYEDNSQMRVHSFVECLGM